MRPETPAGSAPASPATAARRPADVDLFLLDMDGTIYLGDRLFGAVAAADLFKIAGADFRVLFPYGDSFQAIHQASLPILHV